MNAPPVETLAERFYQLFGKQALDEMIEMPAQSAPMRAAITESELDEAGRAAELSVRGFISRPEVQRANRNGIYVFVNRRLVRDRLLLHAVHEAYRNILPSGVFPGGAAVPRSAGRGSGRQRSPRKDRSALPPPAIRARFRARRHTPDARPGAARAELCRAGYGFVSPWLPARPLRARETAPPGRWLRRALSFRRFRTIWKPAGKRLG